jgi:hypothetical protein
MFNQERAREKSHKIGETFAEIDRIFGKIIGTSGTTAKADMEIGETYGATWQDAEATTVKPSEGQEKPATTSVVAGFVLDENLLSYGHDLSHPPFINLNHIGPGGDRRESRDRHAPFCRNIVQTALKPLPRRTILRARRKQTLRPLCDFFRRQRLAMCNGPSEQFVIRSACQHPQLKRLRIDLKKIDQVFIEAHRDVVIILNLTGVSEMNLVNKPPQVGNAAEQGFGAAGVSLLCHSKPSPRL